LRGNERDANRFRARLGEAVADSSALPENIGLLVRERARSIKKPLASYYRNN
jgi:hypothetical protein